jgi:Kef-type K+ transport system membrane component KefB/mannitol/fructose-specific phosphotransferase system IIA component (Ntr-type)
MVQVLVVLALARLLGEFFRFANQPPLGGEILAGVLLGQTVLGNLAPDLFASLFPIDEVQDAMFRATAELGIMFLLLMVGLEVNVASAWKMRNQTFTVAVTGVVVPLALGVGVSWLLYEEWIEGMTTAQLPFSLLVGAGVSITAITVVARVLFDLKVIKSDLGLFLVSAMALNELLGWAVLAVVLGLVGIEGAGQGDASGLAGSLLGVLAFSAFALTLGRSLTTRCLLWMEARGLPSPEAPLSLVTCLGLLGGVITSWLGIHPVFGFLLAGMMAGDPRALSEHTRSIIEQMVGAIFVPLFFAGICLRIDFIQDFNLSTVAIVTALSVGGKFIGAGMGTLMVELPAANRMPVAIAHIPGGPMGVLLASVAISQDIIGPQMFVALVIASVVSALLVGPAFAWQLAKLQTQDVSGYFARERVLWDLRVASRTDAIDQLTAHAARAEGMADLETLRRAVAEREAVGGTGVGGGIAVPHARIAGLPAPLVVCGLCKDGVEWDAVDGKPAHLIFLILTSTADEADIQLEILASIASSFSDRATSQRLLDSRSLDAAWENLRRSITQAA